MILMDRIGVPNVPLKDYIFSNSCFHIVWRTTDRGSDLKLQRRSWQWYNSSLALTLAGEFSFCGQTTAPGCCTCWGLLRWRAVKAREGSYWPGKLIFANVINRIIILTLAGEFSNLLLQLTGAFGNKKWKIITILYKKVKIHYFYVLKSEKSLFFI